MVFYKILLFGNCFDLLIIVEGSFDVFVVCSFRLKCVPFLSEQKNFIKMPDSKSVHNYSINIWCNKRTRYKKKLKYWPLDHTEKKIVCKIN